jgi:catechol 2,3-dioxygenase-like lactoylglutathione lyase family enzyme
MFTIGMNFHVIHMTDDLDELDAWYDDVFSVVRWMNHQHSEILARDASLVLISDLCIEPMAPAFQLPNWDSVALGRFFKRFGKRWHSIAWYMAEADDIVELYHHLIANDVRVYSGTGTPSPDSPPRGALFTHPGDTFTQLEFVAPRSAGPTGPQDPRFGGAHDPGWWSNHHPLGVTKSSHVTLAVHDVAAARDRYVSLLGGNLLYEGDVALTQTRSAFVAVGDLVIELAQPQSGSSAIAKDLDANNQGVYAVTLQVKDLTAASEYLEGKGIRFSDGDARTLLSDPATTHGVVFGFTTWSIPNDARPSF